MSLNGEPHRPPRRDFLFEIVAFISKLQLHSQMRGPNCSKRTQLLFSITMGAAAIGTLTAAAVVTDLPLLFPPLAPSAFILFTTPLAPNAAPRSVILGHLTGVLSGLIAVITVSAILPEAGLGDPSVMNAPRVVTIVLAMGLVTKGMLLLKASHPPAAATALIAAMGWIDSPMVTAALVASACLLCLEAVILLRIIGGLPYPFWNHDYDMARFYGTLAGTCETKISGWERVHEDLLSQHDDLPTEPHETIDEDRTEVLT